MTKHVAENNILQVVKDMRYGLRQIIYISVPMTVIFIFYRYPILNLVYGGNRFGEKSIDETAMAMLFYCFGIPSFCAMKIISSAFYAQKDTKTPVKVALWCILLNFIINLALMFPLKQGGIALGTVISSIVNCLVLTYIFKKRHAVSVGNNEVLLCLCKISFSSLIAVLVSICTVNFSNMISFISLIDWKGLVSLCMGFMVFCVVYLIINHAMKSEEQRDWVLLIKAKLR